MTPRTPRPRTRSGAIPLRYNVRSLQQRWVTTLLAVAGVALVVSTFIAVLALAGGLAHTMSGESSPENAILLYKGGISEAMSRVTMEQFQMLRLLPQIRQNSHGEPLASLDSLVQINCPLKTGVETIVVLRGLRPIGREVHKNAHLCAGRWFTDQSGECVVGKRVMERFAGMALDQSFAVGRRNFRIVGVMTAGGSGPESEIWADRDDVVSAAHRDWFNSSYVVLNSPSQIKDFERSVRRDPRIDLAVRSERDYYAEQAADADGFRTVGLVVCFFMAIGACLAEMNTMYSAIASRMREIGTLRILGFTRLEILTCFLLESIILAVLGGILGCLVGQMFNGWSMSIMSFANVSEVSFELLVTPVILAQAFGFSLVLGILGGLLPALQAAYLPILKTLRKI